MKRVLLCLALYSGACGDSAAPSEPDAAVGADQTVVAFDGEHVYFGDPNRRVVDVPVSFPPAALSYERVTLRFALRCPNDRCDWWDRLGWLAIVDGEQEIELLRFITPYRLPGSWEVDVTDLRPLLAGDVTVRVFIDTWVGPGHQNGDGWLVDASFDLVGGVPEREAIAVTPLWAPAGVAYGDPAAPPARTATAALPADATAATVRLFVTGHGQGNAGNCAEFCARDHHLDIAGNRLTRNVWRDDCETTAVPDQYGTWELPRAGWCPGDTVDPWAVDFGVGTAAGTAIAIGYDVEPYENTCRPDSPSCTGCTLGTGCDYDGGAHTPPTYYLSGVLVSFR